MNIGLGWKPITIELNGEPVTMEIRPLKVKEVLRIAKYFTGDTMSPEDTLTAQSEADSIFKEAVRKIEGITVDDKPVTPDMLGEYTLFTQLATEILNRLISISTLEKNDEKNSERPSVDTGQKVIV